MYFAIIDDIFRYGFWEGIQTILFFLLIPLAITGGVLSGWKNVRRSRCKICGK